MPIRIACTECGKKLAVRDELAGKKVKCPGCGAVILASADAGAAAVKAAPPRPAPPSAKDKVSAKPMAQRPAPPPIDDEDDADERPVRSPSRGAERFSNDAKASSRRASSKLPWIVLSLVLVLAVGAAGTYFVFFHEPGGSGPIAKGKGKQGGGGNNAGQIQAEGTSMALADLIPGDAIFFASLSGEAWNAQALQPLRQQFGDMADAEVQKNLGIPLAEVERVSVFTVASFADMMQKKNAKTEVPIVVVVQAKSPFDQDKVTAAIKGSDGGQNVATEFLDAKTLAISNAALLQTYKGKRGQVQATPLLQRAITQASASKGVVIAVDIPPEAMQLAGPAAQVVPPTLLKTKAVLASLDLTDKLRLDVSLIMDDAATATALKKDVDGLVGGLPFMIDGFIKEPQAAKMVKQMLADLKINVQDKELTIAFQADAGVAIAMLLPAIQKVREAAASTIELNNLRQIALAFHNYHDANNKRLPPQTLGKGLSWRVAILPYIDQDNLYREFKLDEPWDSEHNKTLLAKMPKIYASPHANVPPGFTQWQLLTGPKSLYPKMQQFTLANIPDGSSNTMLVAEATQPVEWTKPVDIVVDDKSPIPLGSGQAPYFYAAFADASSRRMLRKIDDKALRQLIDPIDGLVIDIQFLEYPPRPIAPQKPGFGPPPGKKFGQFDKKSDKEFKGSVEKKLADEKDKFLRQQSQLNPDVANLQQLGRCWIGYSQEHKSFPPQTFRNGLSWRVAILPFLNEGELYKQFKLDEPWDSEHNRKLLARMPKVYAPIADTAPDGHTFYQTLVGPRTINKDPKKGARFGDIEDGSSNVIMLTKGDRPVPWTKPEDVVIDPTKGFRLGDTSGIPAVMVDGGYRRIPRIIEDRILRLLIDPADGVAIRIDEVAGPPLPLAKSPSGKAAAIPVLPENRRIVPGKGVIQGQIILEGTAPKNPDLKEVISNTANNGPFLKGPMVRDVWRVNKTAGLANCVVWLEPVEGSFEQLFSKEEVTVRIGAAGFVPRVSLVKLGQSLKFVDDSKVLNSIRVEQPESPRPANFTLAPGKQQTVHLSVTNKPTPLTNDFHRWMDGIVWPVDKSYAATSNDNGSFTIHLVPDDVEVRVIAWHEGVGYFYGGTKGTRHTFKAGENQLKLKVQVD